MNQLTRSLDRHPRIALDTCVFIYALDDNPRYADLAEQVLAWIEQPGHSAVTSTITLTELLVKPYMTHEEEGANRVRALLLTYPNLEWIAADLEIASIAARFRADYKLRTPDALQAATAAHSDATLLVTNDARSRRIQAFETLILDDLL